MEETHRNIHCIFFSAECKHKEWSSEPKAAEDSLRIYASLKTDLP